MSGNLNSKEKNPKEEEDAKACASLGVGTPHQETMMKGRRCRSACKKLEGERAMSWQRGSD